MTTTITVGPITIIADFPTNADQVANLIDVVMQRLDKLVGYATQISGGSAATPTATATATPAATAQPVTVTAV
jgi:hypothetical protein